MLKHGRRFTYGRIIQHLGSQRNSRDRCLEFMSHIVNEIILYLCQFLLTENDVYGKNKSHQQYQRKIIDGIMNRTELKM